MTCAVESPRFWNLQSEINPMQLVLNCWFLKPTMAGHSPVLTLQFLDVLFS